MLAKLGLRRASTPRRPLGGRGRGGGVRRSGRWLHRPNRPTGRGNRSSGLPFRGHRSVARVSSFPLPRESWAVLKRRGLWPRGFYTARRKPRRAVCGGEVRGEARALAFPGRARGEGQTLAWSKTDIARGGALPANTERYFPKLAIQQAPTLRTLCIGRVDSNPPLSVGKALARLLIPANSAACKWSPFGPASRFLPVGRANRLSWPQDREGPVSLVQAMALAATAARAGWLDAAPPQRQRRKATRSFFSWAVRWSC